MKRPIINPTFLLIISIIYFLCFTFQFPFLFSSSSIASSSTFTTTTPTTTTAAFTTATTSPPRVLLSSDPIASPFTLTISPLSLPSSLSANSASLYESAIDAWAVGKSLLSSLPPPSQSQSISSPPNQHRNLSQSSSSSCFDSVVITGAEIRGIVNVLPLPCGLTLGSQITVVGTPHKPHYESDPKITARKVGGRQVGGMVLQFMMELRGLGVENEDGMTTRILHVNPRLVGDWSGKPVIEMNTAYRTQWGRSHRCEGWKSRDDEELG